MPTSCCTKYSSDKHVDTEYEKLLIARSYEALAECAKALKHTAEYNESLYLFYNAYPQLVPFSELRPNMRLSVIGTPDAAIVSRLKSCNINWVSDRSIPAPEVTLKFSRNGNKKTITYFVTDKSGKEIVNREDYTYTSKPEEAAVILAYRLFNTDKKAIADPKK